jgi:hypothetical protein
VRLGLMFFFAMIRLRLKPGELISQLFKLTLG